MKMIISVQSIAVIVAVLNIGTASTAKGQNPTVPNLVSFQARVTDAGGQPVVDGTYPVTFNIFRNESGGVTYWTESATISTTGGILVHNLGSTPGFELPTDIFFSVDSAWLQVTFNGEIQVPRVLLVSSPFSRLADGLSARSTLHPDQLAVYTDVENHRLIIDGKNASTVVDLSGKDWGSLKLTDSMGIDAALLSTNGAEGGSLDLLGAGAGGGVHLHGGLPGQGATLRLVNSGGGTAIYMDADGTDNFAVSLPANSIGANEVLDEPGVAQQIVVPLTVLAMGVQNITSRTINCPAAGYVLAMASCNVSTTHSSGMLSLSSYGVSQSSATLPSDQSKEFRVPPTVIGDSWGGAISAQKVFSVDEGPNTFYFVGNLTNGNASVREVTLSVIYFPTQRGLVTE